MTDLFDIAPSPSPRLAWMAAHGILTHHAPHMTEAPWMAIQPQPEDKGKSIGAIMAESCRLYDEIYGVGYGMTEIEALDALAAVLKLPLWNQ